MLPSHADVPLYRSPNRQGARWPARGLRASRVRLWLWPSLYLLVQPLGFPKLRHCIIFSSAENSPMVGDGCPPTGDLDNLRFHERHPPLKIASSALSQTFAKAG